MSYALYKPVWPMQLDGMGAYAAYRPVRPIRLDGLGAEADVRADLDATVGASKTDAVSSQSASDNIIAYAQDAEQLRQYYDQLKRYIPKKPTLAEATSSWSGAAEWGKAALINYGKAQLAQYSTEVIDQTASAYGLEGCIPDHLPDSNKEALHMLADGAAAGACVYMGIDPKLGITTERALYDGKLSAEECEAIGAVAGAAAGAAIGQMYGIPAPIGAFIGGKIGGLVGKGFAKIFGLSSAAYEEWLRKQKKIAHEMYVDADSTCFEIRKGFWDLFDKLIVETEYKWERNELDIGRKFDLRWYRPASQLSVWIEQQIAQYRKYVDGPYCQTYCNQQVTISGKEYLSLQKIFSGTKPPSDAQLAEAMKRFNCADTPNTLCAYACRPDFGCLYPRFKEWTKANPPKDARLFGSSQRVIDAFLARGVEWAPPATGVKLRQIGPTTIYAAQGEERSLICTQIKEATKREIERDKKHWQDTWLAFVNQVISIENKKLQNLRTVGTQIINDVIKTAAIAAAQKKVEGIVAQAKKEQAAMVKRVAPKIITDPGIAVAQTVNTGSLISGGGVLGYALWSLL